MQRIRSLAVRVFLTCVAAGPAAVNGCAETAPINAGQRVQTPEGTAGTNHPAVLDRDYVVLVSFDGLRHDYLERVETPAFDQLAATGVRADALIPVFPSLTFPTHYSMATGMYPGRHGIVGNRFYDPNRDAEFNYRRQDDVRDGSWWGGEPIWVTAERQGMTTAAYFYPGTEASIQGIRPSRWRPYDGSIPNEDRVADVLEWLQLPPDSRPHVVTLYFSLVDTAGHSLGPDATALSQTIRQADGLLETLLAGIDSLSYGDRVYVVVVSDHGMAAVRDDDAQEILLGDVVDVRGMRAVFLGPDASLHTDGRNAQATRVRGTFNRRVDDSLAEAFLRREAPAHLHLHDNPRFGDVVVVPTVGTRIAVRRDASPPAGMHGWDPTASSMHGIFLARGPGLAAGARIPPFENIHIYPFLAEVLELEPNRVIDGERSVLGSLLAPRE